MHYYRCRIMSLALFVLVPACVSYSSGKLKVENYSLLPVNVGWEADTKDGVFKVDENFTIDAAQLRTGPDGKPVIGPDGNPEIIPVKKTLSVRAPKGGKLRVTYTPGSSTTKFKPENFTNTVSEADSFSRAMIIPTKPVFDSGMSVSELRSLAEQIDAGPGKRLLRLIDLAPRANSLIVATITPATETTPEKVDVHAVISLPGEPPSLAPSQDIETRAIINNNVVNDSSLMIPVYGSLRSNVQVGKVYSLVGKTSHYHFTNNFNVVKALSSTDDDTRKIARDTVLSAPQNAKLVRVDNMHVVSSASWSLTEGTKIEGTVEAAVASVFTTSGSYVFKHESSKQIVLDDVVTTVQYKEPLTRDAFLSLIDSKGKYISPSAPPLEEEKPLTPMSTKALTDVFVEKIN